MAGINKIDNLLQYLKEYNPKAHSEVIEKARAAAAKQRQVIEAYLQQGGKLGPQEMQNLQMNQRRIIDKTITDELTSRGHDVDTFDPNVDELTLRRQFQDPDEATKVLDTPPPPPGAPKLPKASLVGDVQKKMDLGAAGKDLLNALSVPQRMAYNKIGEMFGVKGSGAVEEDDVTGQLTGENYVRGADFMKAADIGKAFDISGKVGGASVAGDIEEGLGLLAEMGVDPMDLMTAGVGNINDIAKVAKMAGGDKKRFDKIISQLLKKEKPTQKDVLDALGGDVPVQGMSDREYSARWNQLKNDASSLMGRMALEQKGIPSIEQMSLTEQRKLLDKLGQEYGNIDPEYLKLYENPRFFGALGQKDIPGETRDVELKKIFMNPSALRDSDKFAGTYIHEVGGHGRDNLLFGDFGYRASKNEGIPVVNIDSLSEAVDAGSAGHIVNKPAGSFEAKTGSELVQGVDLSPRYEKIGGLFGTRHSLSDDELAENLQKLRQNQVNRISEIEDQYGKNILESEFNWPLDKQLQMRKAEEQTLGQLKQSADAPVKKR